MKFQSVHSGLLILMLILKISNIVGCSGDMMVESSAQLREAVEDPPPSGIIRLAPGTYELSPRAIMDSTCANCTDPSESVPATAGLILSGKKMYLIGPEDQSARIVTNAGYGVFFRNCQDGLLKNLTITGGIRDTDPRASSAAVVVQNSSARIINNIIRDNIGDSSIVVKNIVGVIGIAGREGAQMEIVGNRIERNSWDAIALYRNALASIHGNYIDGVDSARGNQVGGGRGVAIGITWNAKAEIYENYITNYWKGIGIFVDGHAVVERNIIENILTWGIAYWDAGYGRPWARISGNIIYDTGACGVNLSASADSGVGTGYFRNNIIVKTAQNPKYDSPDYYCFQCALSIFDTPDDFKIERNLFFNNRRSQENLPDYDLAPEAFRDSLATRIMPYTELPFWTRTKFFREIVSNLE